MVEAEEHTPHARKLRGSRPVFDEHCDVVYELCQPLGDLVECVGHKALEVFSGRLHGAKGVAQPQGSKRKP